MFVYTILFIIICLQKYEIAQARSQKGGIDTFFTSSAPSSTKIRNRKKNSSS